MPADIVSTIPPPLTPIFLLFPFASVSRARRVTLFCVLASVVVSVTLALIDSHLQNRLKNSSTNHEPAFNQTDQSENVASSVDSALYYANQSGTEVTSFEEGVIFETDQSDDDLPIHPMNQSEVSFLNRSSTAAVIHGGSCRRLVKQGANECVREFRVFVSPFIHPSLSPSIHQSIHHAFLLFSVR